MVDRAAFVAIFDALLIADIYKPAEMMDGGDRLPGEVMLSENTRVELENLQTLQAVTEIPPPVALDLTPAGIVSSVDLRQDTFIALTEGYVVDLEEFTYDDGVDSALFQIMDTRLVLDVRDVPDPLLLRLGRSMLGNVVIRLLRIGPDVKAGIFVARTLLTCYRSTDDFILPAGEPLRFGIDFLPAMVEDLGRWIGWTCADVEQTPPSGGIRPSRDERELQAAMRQIEAKKPKGAKPKRKDSSHKKSKGGRKSAKRRSDGPNGDISLFELFEAEGPLGYMFMLADDPDGEEVVKPAEIFQRPTSPLGLRRPPSRPAEVAREQTIEFEKTVQTLLTADMEPVKFDAAFTEDIVGPLIKILSDGYV
jgi:hypothetical protein